MTVLFDCCESDKKVGIFALNFLAALKLVTKHCHIFSAGKMKGKN